MAKTPIDLTGQRFGRLTAVRFEHASGNHKRNTGNAAGGLWVCVCDCGNTRKNRSGVYHHMSTFQQEVR